MRRISGLIPAALLVLASCATVQRSNDPGDQVTLRVQNNIAPSTSVTVFAVEETGNRRQIGFVRPAETTSVSFPAETGNHEYFFVARVEASPPATTGPNARTGFGVRDRRIDDIPSSTASTIVSQRIDLARGGIAHWDLSSNLVSFVAENSKAIDE